jgi:hypothetical protein
MADALERRAAAMAGTPVLGSELLVMSQDELLGRMEDNDFEAERRRLQNLGTVLGFCQIWEYIWEDRFQAIFYLAASWLYFPRINIIGELREAHRQVGNVREALLDEEIEAYEREHPSEWGDGDMFPQQNDFWERFDHTSDSS